MNRDDNHSNSERDDLGVYVLIVFASLVFIAVVILVLIPFTRLAAGKPWYFWWGSAVLALALGAALCYAGARLLR
jgi:hypothetical protein